VGEKGVGDGAVVVFDCRVEGVGSTLVWDLRTSAIGK
jgi:hypothetical protein